MDIAEANWLQRHRTPEPEPSMWDWIKAGNRAQDHSAYAGHCGECGAVAVLCNTTWWDCINPYCDDTKTNGLVGDKNYSPTRMRGHGRPAFG